MISYSKWLEPHDALFLIGCRTIYVSETKVQSLPNYHIAQKWLWHSGAMALPEWWGGRPWVKEEQRSWKADGSLCTCWERTENCSGKNSYRKMEHGTWAPPTLESEKHKKAQECGWRIGGIGTRLLGVGAAGGQWGHELIHFVSREISTSPTCFTFSRLEACTKSLPLMGQVVLIYWIQILMFFFFYFTGKIIFQNQPTNQHTEDLLLVIRANTKIAIW